jgi:hypothetical protein
MVKMLTPKQIENWCKVLSMTFGAWAFIMADSEVQAFHDKFQGGIDAIKHNWLIRIKFDIDTRPILDVDPEPIVKGKTVTQMRDWSKRMIEHYPQISMVRVEIVNSPHDNWTEERVEV